jgi:hypothetical protein
VRFFSLAKKNQNKECILKTLGLFKPGSNTVALACGGLADVSAGPT